MSLIHLSLFTGIGGIDLAAEWAGFETICFVENNEYCQKVLKKHWPDVPIIGDIHDVTKEKVMAYAEQQRLLQCPGGREREQPRYREGLFKGRSKDGRVDREQSQPSITLITGGFPCQPVSVAGKQRGKEDDRWLWPEMLRVIKEIRPGWVVAENVAGLIRMGLDDCISGLENIGYTTEPYLIPACAVNAPHRRDRIFIVGYSDRGRELQSQRPIQEFGEWFGDRSQDVADTNTARPQRHRGLRECGGEWLTWQGNTPLKGIWESEPDVGRVAHGLSTELDGGVDEILRILWAKYGTTKMVKREARQHLEQSPILLNQMLRRLDTLTEQGTTKEWSEASPKTVGESSLREMWAYCWLTTASQRQKSFEQQSREPRSSMSDLSQERPPEGFKLGDYWLQEPNIPRVARGISNRVNRLKALGNAVVPQQIYPILKAIADIEKGK